MYARQYIPTGWADETILVSERPSKACMLGAGYEVLCEGIFIYRQSAIVSVIAFAQQEPLSAVWPVRVWRQLQLRSLPVYI